MKIHFKTLGKDHEEKTLSIKKTTKQNDQTLPQKTSNLYKVDYKIQDTDGFQKIKMIVPLQGRTALTTSAAWEPQSRTMIQGTVAA